MIMDSRETGGGDHQLAAEFYGSQILLVADIEDDQANFTRFLPLPRGDACVEALPVA
jgi:hypothetical protein